MGSHDLALRWTDSGSVNSVLKRGGVPLSGYPKHLRVPGGQVAVVKERGKVALWFRAKAIEGPQVVTMPDRKVIDRGYFLHADRRTIRKPGQQDHNRLSTSWYAVGQMAYFDASTGRRVFVGGREAFGDRNHMESRQHVEGLSFRAYSRGIPGLRRDHPEARLIDQYIAFLEDSHRFGHHYIPSARLFTDLFDFRRWRLIEAKVRADRTTARTAVGQLLDYKRFFARVPSMGVLFGERPPASVIEFLVHYRVTPVWRTKALRFSDASPGRAWTIGRRLPPV